MASAPPPPTPTPKPDSIPPASTVIETDLKLHGVEANPAEEALTLTCDGLNFDSPGPAPQAPAPPGYELLSELGRGGMGVVYKARQRSLNRVVALKVVLAGGHASGPQRIRFLAEAEAVASLNHVGIVGVYEFGTWGDQPYMALEFCPGGTLADRLRGTPMSWRDAAATTEQLARAVYAAHERAIVHRDIKPANVLLTADGTPKLGDFGLAKMTETEGITVTGAVLGTPSYMAPEQARGHTKSVGPAADVYALGALLYECLTGRPPFRGASPADTIIQALSQEPVGVRALNPVVPVDLETVCLKCLEKDAARRYSSAKALAEDLQRLIAGMPVLARPVGPIGRARRWVARNQIVAALLAAVALAIIAGTTTTYVKYLDEAKQRATAEDEATKKAAALDELRVTLAKLEKLTGEQAKTLEQLRAEKAATEDALLRGLMRPLRNHPGNTLLLEEARALADLAGLPEERLRFRFVGRGLESADGSDKIAAWPQEIVGGVVGLDHAAAVRLRATVVAALGDPATSRSGQVACAFLIGALPDGDPEADRLAARVLVEQMGTRPASALGELSAGFQALLPRLTATDQEPLARPLIERMKHEQDVVALGHLSGALGLLAKHLTGDAARAATESLVARLTTERIPGLSPPVGAAVSALAAALPPRDAGALADELARNLVSRVPTEQDTNAIASGTTALASLAHRLPADREQAVLAPVVRALAARCVADKESPPVGHLARALAGLVTGASPTDRVTAATALATRAEAEKDPITLSDVAGAFATVAATIPTADTERLVEPLLARLATEADSTARNYLAPPLAEILGRLSPTRAAALVRVPALALVDKLATTKDPQALAEYSSTLTPVARFLGPADAATAAGRIADRMKNERDINALDSLATSLGGVCAQLPPANAGALAKGIVERALTEKDVAATSRLAAALTHLAGRQTAANAEALTGKVASAVVSQLLAEKDPETCHAHAATLDRLATGLNPTDAAAAGKALAARLATEQDAALCSAYALALSSVAARLTADAEAALIAAPTRKVAEQLVSAREFASVNSAVKALNVLAPQLAPADAAAVVKLVVERTAAEREHAWHYLADGLWDTTARQLDPADAAECARVLLGRLETEKDAVVVKSLCRMLGIVAVRLGGDEAAASARAVARKLVSEKEPGTQLALGQAFAAHAHQLSDADLLALLKAHVAFPQVRVPILAEFGRRAGRTRAAAAVAGPIAPAAISAPPFASVWDFRAWAQQAYPDLDLQAAPPADAGG